MTCRTSVFLLARDFGVCYQGVKIGVLAIPTETAGEEVGSEQASLGGLHTDLGCSGPTQSKTSLRRHSLKHKHLANMLPAGDLCSSFTKGNKISEQPYTVSSSLFVTSLVWQHLITTWVNPGSSAHASEQPCSAQVLISAPVKDRRHPTA